MILDKLNFFYFILSFSVGIFLCYVTTPPAQIVLKFPSPSNAGKVIYKDKDGQCYSYKADKSVCRGKGVVKAQPIMEDFKNAKKHF